MVPRTNKRYVLLLVPLLLAPSIYAISPSTATGTFSGSVVQTAERDSGGNKFLTLTDASSYLGTFIGSFAGTGTAVVHLDCSINFHSTGTWTGTVDGKSGTVEITFEGTGMVGLGAFIVGQYTLSHGTGGLANLHGGGTFSALFTSTTTIAGTYAGEFHFDPN